MWFEMQKAPDKANKAMFVASHTLSNKNYRIFGRYMQGFIPYVKTFLNGNVINPTCYCITYLVEKNTANVCMHFLFLNC